MERFGIHVPEKLSVVGVDDTELAKFTYMTFTVNPKRQLGQYAAKEILSSESFRTKVFDPSLVQRNTVARIE